MKKIKIVTVIGARPQFIKAAVISRLIRDNFKNEFEEYLVHTGQHYDKNMNEIFFEEMDIPQPHIHLAIGSGSHGQMTGRMLEKIEQVLLEQRPDIVLVYGDTNSTLAGALAAVKLHIPVAHIEAGLRSFFMAMPEEINRILTDRVSSYLFCPTENAIQNLNNEGMRDGIFHVGDIMLDASLYYRQKIDTNNMTVSVPDRDFILSTIHRAENTDNDERLTSIFIALNEIAKKIPVILPLHPRTKKKFMDLRDRIDISIDHIQIVDPVGFFEMLYLEDLCSMIITDSGGVQKEAYFFNKPCITLRDQTEWIETVESGWNVIAGADKEKIIDVAFSFNRPATHPDFYGQGKAGKEILEILRKF